MIEKRVSGRAFHIAFEVVEDALPAGAVQLSAVFGFGVERRGDASRALLIIKVHRHGAAIVHDVAQQMGTTYP